MIRPTQCPQCSAWCLLTLVDGFKVAADPSPLDAAGARGALLTGRKLYSVMHGFKRKSQPRQIRGLRRLVSPQALRAALDEGVCVAEHPCRGSFTSVPLKAPQAAVQSVCPGRAGCTRTAVGQKTCEVCDPPPFGPAIVPSGTVQKSLDQEGGSGNASASAQRGRDCVVRDGSGGCGGIRGPEVLDRQSRIRADLGGREGGTSSPSANGLQDTRREDRGSQGPEHPQQPPGQSAPGERSGVQSQQGCGHVAVRRGDQGVPGQVSSPVHAAGSHAPPGHVRDAAGGDCSQGRPSGVLRLDFALIHASGLFQSMLGAKVVPQ